MFANLEDVEMGAKMWNDILEALAALYGAYWEDGDLYPGDELDALMEAYDEWLEKKTNE